MEAPVRLVLDTDILIDFLRGKRKAVEAIRRFREQGRHLATTVVNVFELSWGAHRLGGDRVRAVERLASSLTVLPLGVREAFKAAEEMAYLQSLGLSLDVRDLLIGVIARENGYSIFTGNVRHLSRIRGLNVIGYNITNAKP